MINKHLKQALLFKVGSVMELAKALNLDVILSSTAMPATSSVRWHKKNGFIPYKITHYEGRNYNSYNFIKPARKSLKVRVLILISPLTLFVSKITKLYKI